MSEWEYFGKHVKFSCHRDSKIVLILHPSLKLKIAVEQRTASRDGSVCVHRRRIINAFRLAAVHPSLECTYEMESRGGIRLTTGRQYRETIQALIKNQSA